MSIYVPSFPKYRLKERKLGSKGTMHFANRMMPDKPLRITHLDNILISYLRRGAVVTFHPDGEHRGRSMGVVLRRQGQDFWIAIREAPAVYVYTLTQSEQWTEYRVGVKERKLNRFLKSIRYKNLRKLFTEIRDRRKAWKAKISEFEAETLTRTIAPGQPEGMATKYAGLFKRFMELIRKTYDFPLL